MRCSQYAQRSDLARMPTSTHHPLRSFAGGNHIKSLVMNCHEFARLISSISRSSLYRIPIYYFFRAVKQNILSVVKSLKTIHQSITCFVELSHLFLHSCFRSEGFVVDDRLSFCQSVSHLAVQLFSLISNKKHFPPPHFFDATHFFSPHICK